MRLSLRAIGLWFVAASSADGSFLSDVVRTNRAVDNNRVQEELLEKAVPLEEYKADLRTRGLDLGADNRGLQDNAMDDYYMDAAYINDFSGFSLKYAACQPVQKFSEDAITAGEYTPLVTDDIVILRLCPTSSCNPRRAFGCSTKYVDYAVSISDYIRIMLRYKMDKKQELCNWCTECVDERRLEDGVDDAAQNQDGEDQNANEDDQAEQDQEQVAQEDDDGQNNAEAAAGDDQAAGDDSVGANDASNVKYSSSCPDFYSYCYADGVSVCDDTGADSSGYLDAEGYLNYLDCQHVDGYYLRPRCNGYDQTITMGVYYDKFCSQYAGDKMNLNSVFGNLGIEPYAFREFYGGNTCIDCSESESGPFYDANSNMCNRLHRTAAACNTNIQSEIFNSSSFEDESQCIYLEMLRKGAYDEEGRIYTSRSIIRRVTDAQKLGLVASLLFCGLLAVYSCYLHHMITNLLVRSISHTELLPSSRTSRRSKGSRRVAPSQEEDDDWQEVSKISRKRSSRSNWERSHR